MKLTRLGDYAVRGVIHLAMKREGEIATSAEIAAEQNIPHSFLVKVMQSLCRSGLVKVFRGKNGGFTLAMDAKEITIRNVIEAVEGPIYLNRCLVREGECPRDSFCSAHRVWIEAQEALVRVLDSYSVADLAVKQSENLKRVSAG